MSAIEYSIERVSRVIDTIKSLHESEFPYEQSKQALSGVDDIFQERLALLEAAKSLSDHEDVADLIHTVCAESLETIFRYLPLLGFVLRSTNVRNAFEVHGPVSRLAQGLLESDTKLLVASEWDYSPLAYSDIPGMESFVLLGLPSPESSNPLLIPLAGHELGHALWSKLNLTTAYNDIATSSIQNDIDTHTELLTAFSELYGVPPDQTDKWSDIFVSSTISPSVTWTVRQAEETFCDFVGLRIFGEAFLYAFAYLLSPGEGFRQVEYPSIPTRISNLLKAAKKWTMPSPNKYEKQFMPQWSPPPFVEESDKAKFLLELTDRALLRQVNDLIERADRCVTEKGIPFPDSTIIKEIRKRIDLTIPAEKSKQIANILNAGWNAYLDDDLWSDYPHIHKDVRRERLRELILKNIEILDLEQRRPGAQ